MADITATVVDDQTPASMTGQDDHPLAEDADELVFPEMMGAMIQEAVGERLPEARIWDVCRAYLEDRQNLMMDKTTQNFVQSTDGQRNKSIVNLLKPIYRTLNSLLSTMYPGFRVSPASPTTEDIGRAQASSLALDWYWQEEAIQYSIGKLVRWLIVCGNAAFKEAWDEQKKKVTTTVYSPYDIVFEPGTIDPDEADWIGLRSLPKREDLIKAYPRFKDEILEAAAITDRDQQDRNINKVPKNRIEIYEVYWRDGRRAVLLKDTYLFQSHTPKAIFPVQFVRYTDIPGKLWGQGVFQSLIDLQNQYNRGRQLTFDSADLMANPIWMVPKNCGITNNGISNAPGKKVWYDPSGGTPARLPGVGMPPDFYKNLETIQSEILDLSGVHSTTMGKRAIGVSSGVAIRALSALDIGQLQMTQDHIEQSVREMCKCVLVLMQAYMTGGLAVKMLSLAGRVVKKDIAQADFVDTPNVYIEANSLFRSEGEDKDAQTMQMYQDKLLEPQEAKARLGLHVGDMDSYKKMMAYSQADDALHVACGFAGADKGIEILPTDDVEAYKTVFAEFIQSPEYNFLTPDRQQYVRDILVRLANPNATAEQFGQIASQKIWPIQPTNPQDQASDMAASQSPLGGAQINEEAKHMAMLKSQALSSGPPGMPPASPMGAAGMPPAPPNGMPVPQGRV